MEGSLARALYNFRSNNPGDLSVPEGGIIRITQYIDKNWLEAEYQGKSGFFPVTYALRLENEPQLHNVVSSGAISSSLEPQGNITFDDFHHHDCLPENTGKSFVEAAFGFVARNESELTFPTGALLEVMKDVDDDWLEGSFNGQTGLFPKSYIKSSEKPCARAIYPFVGESAGELTFREGDRIFLRKRLNSQWMEGEINGNVGLFPSSFVAVEVDLPLDEGKLLNGDFSFMDTISKQNDQKRSAASKVEWKAGMRGRAVYHFSALYSGDLELNEGDIVTVLRMDDENWLEGQLANGVTGLCPTAYLEPINDTSKPSGIKQWNARNPRFSSRKDFSHHSYPYFIPSAGKDEMSKYSFEGIFSEHCNDFFEPSVKMEDSGRSLLDSSFTCIKDRTPVLMPSNVYTLDQQPKTIIEKDNPVLNPKAALKPRPTESYSVTYLGSEHGQNSTSQSYQTGISPSMSLQSLSDERASLKNSYAVNQKATSSNGLSRPSMTIGQSSSTRYFPNSVRTFSSKGKGIHGRIAEDESFHRKPAFYDDNDDDMLSGNFTSLPSPLLPLPKQTTNDYNNDSSASEDSPITPRRPAPLPPKRNMNNINQVRSNTLPAARSKVTSQGCQSQEVLHVPSKVKGQGASVGEEIKPNAVPYVSSPTLSKRDPSLSPKGSPKMRARNTCSSRDEQLSGPQSWHWKGSSAGYTTEKSTPEPRHSHGIEQLRQIKTNGIAPSTGSGSAFIPNLKCGEEQHVVSRVNSAEETEVPGLTALQDRITETEQNLKKEMNVHAGFKSIAQLVMTDPVKQREMEIKVSQSQQKINEWQEELKHLKDEKVFMVESHRKKMLKNKIAHLEADLEKQVRSQRSLEMLLGVVEENRKKEVMDNLGVCAQLVEKIKKELTGLEVSLHSLTEKPAASSQKHMAEQRQRVLTELVNTERDYCRDLELCITHVLHELQSTQVKDLDCDGLFGNIESVLETSKKLLKSLEDAIQQKEGKDQELGKCFVDIAEEMKEVYAVYCRNHDDAISLMEKYEEMPEIQDAFSKCLEKIREHTRCWDLSSFLIKPVQRVLKYPLLLNELLKYTPEIHCDKYNLIQAISVMTDVANAINEFKRRKDLVIKYKKVEDSGLTNMIQKLSWHSVVKKSTRFNQRLTQLTGLVSQTVDEQFIEEEKRFRGIEKTVKVLWKNVSTYLEEFQEAMECGQASGGNVGEFYQDAATCTEVSTFYRAQKTIGETILIRFMDTVQVQVLSPLNSLLSLFQGPQRLIQKRNDKCLDYDRWSNKIDKIKDRDKLKTAKEELELAKKNYEALNTQLLEEIPGFNEKCMALVVDCLKNFAVAQNRLYFVIQQEYEQLLQLPVVQTSEGDIVEHHSKRSTQVMEQFSDLSFIPCSFVAKDRSRKKRRSVKSPNMTSHDPDAAEDDKDIKANLVDYRGGNLGEGGGVGKTLVPPSPSKILQPRPAPRRISSTSRPEAKSAGAPSVADVTPGEGKAHIVEFNFEAQNTGELSVTEGDLVSVLRHSDTSGNPEWWLIHCNGATGYVPRSFLSPVNDNDNAFDGDSEVDNGVDGDGDSGSVATQDTHRNKAVEEYSSVVSSTNDSNAILYYCADFKFEASSPAELSLEEGQTVVVLQKQDLTGNDEWWLVEANGRKGYVPSSYLTPADD